MITRKIVGITILAAGVLLPAIVLIISFLIDAIKDVIINGDPSLLFEFFWLIAVLVGFGLVIF